MLRIPALIGMDRLLFVAVIKMLHENRGMFTGPSPASKTAPGTYQLHDEHLLNVEQFQKSKLLPISQLIRPQIPQEALTYCALPCRHIQGVTRT